MSRPIKNSLQPNERGATMLRRFLMRAFVPVLIGATVACGDDFEFDQVEAVQGGATATVKAVWVEEPRKLCMWVQMAGLPEGAKKRLTVDIARRGLADDRIRHFELENGNYRICVETGYPPDARFAGVSVYVSDPGSTPPFRPPAGDSPDDQARRQQHDQQLREGLWAQVFLSSLSGVMKGSLPTTPPTLPDNTVEPPPSGGG